MGQVQIKSTHKSGMGQIMHYTQPRQAKHLPPMEPTAQQTPTIGMTLPGMIIKKMKSLERGFTLIELIIYIAIVAIILTSLIPFAWNVIEGGAKSATEQEVFANARYVSERIKYEIRNASGINSVSATSISLSETSGAVNP